MSENQRFLSRSLSQELPDKQSIKLETITKTTTLVGLVFYVIGLLTVNSYLRTLGIYTSDFSLLKIHFIYTGAWVVGSLIIISITPNGLINYIGRKKNLQALNKLIPHFPFIILSFALVVLLFFYITLVTKNSLFSIVTLLHTLFLYLYGLGFCIGMIFLVKLFYSPEEKCLTAIKGEKQYFLPIVYLDHKWLFFSLLSVFCLYCFTNYIGDFSLLVYPALPQQIGGGSSLPVEILVAKDSIADAKQIGIPFESEQLSKPLKILFEENEFYVLEVSGNKPIRFDKKMVKGIKLLAASDNKFNQQSKPSDTVNIPAYQRQSNSSLSE
ncbi:MAG: hypothetical protein JOZ78_23465 [Chroococcidiopsidaceae cyanobacterium CP_BM_ER_R8_30]|nr:hypothetical protein [Chroococcidiopsidaceae cyanobacterium CP_BM_ER_R8_30]